MSSSSPEELALSDLDRSNKGASKQRRDLINAEIAVMRELLPLTESARQRLSQLQVMSLSCVFIRKCNVLRQLFSSIPAETDMPSMCDFSQALTGFLLVTTREGKLVYISENVTDYLGHSMVDMKTQGDSLFDIVDKRDEAGVRAQLTHGGAPEPDPSRDVAFFCRMNMSRTLKRQSTFGDVKVMHVRGHFLPLSDPSSDQASQPRKYVLMATCCPLITPELKESLIQSNTMVFKTVHKMDMTFLEVTQTAEHHLGCSAEEICKTSWYSMLHPEDIHEAREKHAMLIRASHELGCMMTVRMLTMRGEILWVNVVMQVRQSSNSQTEDGVIICISQVISEEEAFQIRMQSHMFALYPPRSAELWSGATLSPPRPVQTEPVCWVPASSSSSPRKGLSAACQGLVQHQQALPTTAFIGRQHEASSYHHNSPPPPPPSSSSPTAMLSSSGHTATLKQMLKRKLQGPCQPAKMPRMSMDDGMRSRRSPCGGQSFEPCVSSPLPPSQFRRGANMPEVFSWSGTSPAPSQVQYQAAHGFPVLVSQQQNGKFPLLASSPCRGSLSPPLSTEQVVPQGEAKVTVPESLFSPDSSPASSPDPQIPRTSPSMKPRTGPVSANVLKDLGNLSAIIQTKNPAAAGSSTAPRIKTEQNVEERHHTGRRRELPVMDAFDIESFFHTLDTSKRFTAIGEDVEKTKQGQTPSPEMSTCLENRPVGKATDLTTRRSPDIKSESTSISVGPFPTGQQHQVQEMPKKAAQPQQSQVDPRELEELLSFFSGEMTATQLNLESLLVSPLDKVDAQDLGSSKQQRCDDGQGGQVCGAGHLDHFLLHGATLDRPQEGFSPVSASDLSGDEEGSVEDKLSQPAKSVERENGEKHGCAPSFGPSPAPLNPRLPQAVPGVSEEDELYQLDKLLSLIASDSGVMLFPDSQ